MMFGGMLSLFSWTYISQPAWSCLRLFRQEVELAADFARPSAGSSSEARIAITARTTRSSINVKARANAECGVRNVEFRGPVQGAVAADVRRLWLRNPKSKIQNP